MEKKELQTMLKNIFLVVLIVTLGFIAVNQIFEYRYKAVLLAAPCELCREANPDHACFNQQQATPASPAYYIPNLNMSNLNMEVLNNG